MTCERLTCSRSELRTWTLPEVIETHAVLDGLEAAEREAERNAIAKAKRDRDA